MMTTKTALPSRRLSRLRRELPLHLLLVPGLIMLAIFHFYPLIGNVMAFEDFKPGLGFWKSPFVGLKHFRTLFALPNIGQVFYNTISIAVLKIFCGTVSAIVVALMLNEVRSNILRRGIQTIIYMPHFLSWVILGSVFTTVFANAGVINRILNAIGIDSVFFLGDKKAFRVLLIVTNVWKNVGFGTVVYLAAITGIDLSLYEAAKMDGAGRLRQTWHVTLPGMRSVIVLLMVLDLGKLLNAGFDQIFNMYNTVVMETADIIDTLVYRLGIQGAKFSLATAVGLFKSVVSFILISSSYYLAYKLADYRIF